METKYKAGDYIVVTGQCEGKLLNKTVRIHKVFADCYMIDTFIPGSAYTVWKIPICEENSYLNKTETVLYGDR